MKLSRPMMRMFAQVARGANTIEKLTALNKQSPNFISETLGNLEREGFIVKKRSLSPGSRLSVEVSSTDYAYKLNELLFQYPAIRFEELLSDSKLLFLAALSEDWMTTAVASQLSGVSTHMLARHRPKLLNRGVIAKKGDLYILNRKAWPVLAEFVRAYKNHAAIHGSVTWKYQDGLLFEVDDKSLVKGSLTGFAAYGQFGMTVGIVKALCWLPEAKLSKETVFVHSLFQIEDSRTLHLALTFYLKHTLSYQKVVSLAMKYGKYTLFTDMVKTLKGESALPSFDKKDFIRIAKMYGVDDVQ